MGGLLPLFVMLVTAFATGCGGAAVGPSAAAQRTSGFIDNGGVRLAFEIDLPPGAGPFPAVVFGHGSGRITRHELRFLSSRWTALGFAVLRFDKRGVGESTGAYSGVGPSNSVAMFDALASDVAAAARFLRGQPMIDPARVGLSGVSQAGWILPVAARQLGGVAFMVLLAGPVCSVGLENYYSDMVEFSPGSLDDAYARLPAFRGPDGFDPVPVLQSINTPTLWLLGEEDRSIPVKTTVDNLKVLAAAGKPYEWRTYPGMGHSLGAAIWDDIDRWVARFRR